MRPPPHPTGMGTGRYRRPVQGVGVGVHIGTSGWSYGHWEGVLYPPGCPPADRLGHYTARFPTVELNSSFYRWPREAGFARWRNRLPDWMRVAVELRHPSWLHEDVFRLLKRHQAAYCVISGARLPCVLRATAT